MSRQKDFHTQMANRRYTKYVNVRKYNKKRGEKTVVSTTANENFVNAHTAILIGGTGFSNGQDLGTLTVTYYVKFSKPSYDLVPET
mgnify:FL=1